MNEAVRIAEAVRSQGAEYHWHPPVEDWDVLPGDTLHFEQEDGRDVQIDVLAYVLGSEIADQLKARGQAMSVRYASPVRQAIRLEDWMGDDE
jgi:hypothetical protein